MAECICGHEYADHYTYRLNGRPQSRCKSCDPLTGVTGNYMMVDGSYEAAMFHAADHDFEPVEQPKKREEK